ncbi:MAG TPA: glycosyltransferase family 2 protein [Actinophytocola sp.]|uniref:glycosyltransferase family 2 protein n=1 Tax=Actinophytocola sp. TaxID=1872138 RepID=UPI002DBAFE52|nr:glycosyltransferase family 2 protein [Actinophytocola sp.]HEU5473349.1 glycosyltransferase family 2 protein [Actinophytocola sp.]
MTMTDWSDVWLIVPVFNESPVVGDVIRNAGRTFCNIVCVDDGSSDNSAAEIRRAGAHLIQHTVNLGAGAAIQSGLEYARAQPGARYFVTFDADGQHQIDDVVTMLHRLRSEDVDIVLGTRFRGDTSNVPRAKRAVLKSVVMLSPHLRRLGLTDAHNGLRAFNRAVAHQMKITLNGMSHASEIIEMITRYHWRVVEQPVTIRYTDYSMLKGQPLINGINIVFDNMLRNKTHL